MHQMNDRWENWLAASRNDITVWLFYEIWCIFIKYFIKAWLYAKDHQQFQQLFVNFHQCTQIVFVFVPGATDQDVFEIWCVDPHSG